MSRDEYGGSVTALLRSGTDNLAKSRNPFRGILSSRRSVRVISCYGLSASDSKQYTGVRKDA